MTGGPVDVWVHRIGVDAVYCDGVLVLSPDQSFSSAVSTVTALFPGWHPDEARRLVREHLPDAVDLAGALRPTAARSPVPLRRRARWVVRVVAAVTGAGCLLTGILLAVHLSVHGPGRVALTVLSERAEIHCGRVIGATADCVDADGTMLVADVSGDRVVVFTARGQVIWTRMFADEGEADRAAADMNSRGLLGPTPDAVPAGRWVIWGTPQGRVSEWAERIRESPAAAN